MSHCYWEKSRPIGSADGRWARWTHTGRHVSGAHPPILVHITYIEHTISRAKGIQRSHTADSRTHSRAHNIPLYHLPATISVATPRHHSHRRHSPHTPLHITSPNTPNTALHIHRAARPPLSHISMLRVHSTRTPVVIGGAVTPALAPPPPRPLLPSELTTAAA